MFKTLQVVRFYDRKRNVLVYVAYSDRVLAGSPKNSLSTVPIMGLLVFFFFLKKKKKKKKKKKPHG